MSSANQNSHNGNNSNSSGEIEESYLQEPVNYSIYDETNNDIRGSINRILNNDMQNLVSMNQDNQEQSENSFSFIQQRNFTNKLDEIFDNLVFTLSHEKQNMKNEKIRILYEKQKFMADKNAEYVKLEKDKEEYKRNLSQIEDLLIPESDIVDLDIGGTHKITTSRKTLCKFPNSSLAALFSGRHKLQIHNNRFFIDREGEIFMLVIEYLRNGRLPYFLNKNDENKFFEELDYWNIGSSHLSMITNLEEDFSVLQFDSEWCAPTLSLTKNNSVIDKQNVQHGIVLTRFCLNEHFPYIEFKITMKIPSSGTSHLFLGVIDKSKYKKELLTSSFWKDSPSSFYWDVWSNKLVKIDEKGTQVGSVSGYGCLCESETETRLAIWFNYKDKCISFLKNGINQGIAFRNVPNNMTPSLDIWFEYGTVEIVRTFSPKEKNFL